MRSQNFYSNPNVEKKEKIDMIKVYPEVTREETDYRFEIIVYMHRKFQMFEFPLF